MTAWLGMTRRKSPACAKDVHPSVSLEEGALRVIRSLSLVLAVHGRFRAVGKG